MGSVVGALGALVIVVGSILALGWLARRGVVSREGTRAGIAVEARASLGQKTSVVVVELEGERWLLGVTPHAVTRLARLPRRERGVEAVEVLDLAGFEDPAAAAIVAFDTTSPRALLARGLRERLLERWSRR
jgi:flagellar protein FliO/FliZ